MILRAISILKQPMDQNNRRKFIFILRGTAIFLMLWGHCIQYSSGGNIDFYENNAFQFIYSFHMPLFMLISGFLFFYSADRRSLSELIVYRSRKLLHPIFMCSIFNYFITTGIMSIISGNFISLIDGPWLGTLNSLWFLWSVLSVHIAAYAGHWCGAKRPRCGA